MLLLSIAAAEHSLKIANAFFVPDGLTTPTLMEAAERGVQVDVIVAGVMNDNPVVRAASRANFDHRSFRLNDEANLNILARDFASAAASLFRARM